MMLRMRVLKYYAFVYYVYIRRVLRQYVCFGHSICNISYCLLHHVFIFWMTLLDLIIWVMAGDYCYNTLKQLLLKPDPVKNCVLVLSNYVIKTMY